MCIGWGICACVLCFACCPFLGLCFEPPFDVPSMHACPAQDKSNIKRSVHREYEDVMVIMREVLMHQQTQSPNALAYLEGLGLGGNGDPLQKLGKLGDPDSLDHMCSLLEAYRSITYQVLKEGEIRERCMLLAFPENFSPSKSGS